MQRPAERGSHERLTNRVIHEVRWPRDSPPLLAARASDQADYGSDSGVVRMAALAPEDGPILSLQTAGKPRSTTGILEANSVFAAQITVRMDKAGAEGQPRPKI